MKLLLCFFLSFTYVSCFHVSSDEAKKEKIIGGKRIDITEAPYYAGFHYDDNFICGATIISNTWVVSAAHCFVHRLYDIDIYGQIRIGASTLNDGELFDIKQVIIHPKYNDKNYDSDIALVKLATPIEFSATQQPLPIVTANEIPKDGQVMRIVGFGATSVLYPGASNTLQSARVTVVSDEVCERSYRYKGPVTDNMFCAESYPKDACGGDSGGPAVVNGKLAGVVSSGYMCATGTYPGVYTKVHKYSDWVIENANLN